MGTKVEAVKKHFSDNKKLYIGIGIGVTVTVVAVAIFKDDTPSEITTLNYNAPKFNWRPESIQTVINLTERSTASKPVHLVGSNLFFSSLSEAARETGHSLSRISKNINGHIPDINGDVFQLLEPAA